MIERAATTHGCDRFSRDNVLAMMAREPEQFRPVITHRLPLDRGLEGFELARQRAAPKITLNS
jgi:threonine dehydrogenase-like Zn-dependent dehydrogenase